MANLVDAIDHFQRKLAHEIDAWDLRVLLGDGAGVVIVDARSEAAFLQEHLPQAMSLPHRNMNSESTRNLSRQAQYVTYCDGIGCNASTKGALKLAELGFEVKELIGGIEWWKRDGYPTETASVAIT
ncbi:MAG TPA: rhodanese-like domain-containing protein [Lacipirellulaceae bacterium]|jgi:rhodanese-related sulfurtransferase|nr:rhodanese-like domain-containing protein [Lacipirellulaceae bacterium]